MDYENSGSGDFIVHFGDEASMRAARKRALEEVREGEAKLAELEQIGRRTEKLRGLVAFLTQWIGDGDESHAPDSQSDASADEKPDADGESTVALAVAVVNRESRKIRAKEVHNILAAEGHQFEPSAISNALYYAAKRAGTIQAASGRGMYAPKNYREDQPTTDYALAGNLGFPAPEGEGAP